MNPASRQRGAALMILVLLAAACAAAAFAAALSSPSARLARDRASERVLAIAREALVAYATARPIDAIVGPGYLPCPDLDDDGWAESTCGSQDGSLGQAARLGRLPWKTLGLPDLRDASGERLWYAVSSKYKGLLNCTVSAECLDMSPGSGLGTITVRDPTGAIAHDGTLADPGRAHAGGAIAVVFAPGPALERQAAGGAAFAQHRDCAGTCGADGRCTSRPASLTPRCHPANYLDAAPGEAFADEDNADFVDRNDAAGRAANRNGFIRGPVVLADGRVAVNDRLAVIAYDDLAPRLARRVAREVARCLLESSRGAQFAGRFPWAAPICGDSGPDAALALAGAPGVRFGRIPEPFPAAAAPGESCPIGGATEPNWWTSWRTQVFYAVAPDFDPSSGTAACATPGGCLELVDADGGVLVRGRSFAVLVAGAPLPAAGQSRTGSAALLPGQWLEGENAALARLNRGAGAPSCAADPGPACAPPESCARATLAPRGPAFNDVVVASP